MSRHAEGKMELEPDFSHAESKPVFLGLLFCFVWGFSSR